MLTLLLLALAADPSPDPMPKFAATLRNAGDKLEVKHEKDVAVWIVTGGGIGGAEVTLKEGTAPKKILVRMAGFTVLESFTVTDGIVALKTAYRRGAASPTQYFDAANNPVTDPTKAVTSISVGESKAGIEVTITTAKPGKKWTLEWVDAYRRRGE